MVTVLRSIVQGPLAPYVTGFCAESLGEGYTRTSAEQHVCFSAHLDRWLLAEGLGVQDLSETTVERYLIERRSAGYVEYRSGKAMRPLMEFLAPLDVLPAEPTVRLDPVEELLNRYRGYLLAERGLTKGTVAGYVHVARPFIASRSRGAELDVAGVTAADVIGFVLASCPGRATGTAKLVVTLTRSRTDWLHPAGVPPAPGATAGPSGAGGTRVRGVGSRQCVSPRVVWRAVRDDRNDGCRRDGGTAPLHRRGD